MKWGIGNNQLYKNKLMILDLLANNDWERPVYFAITVGDDNYMNLQPYFQLEGLAYRIVPIYTPSEPNQPNRGSINTDIMYDNFMNKFLWGNLNHPDVYLDENNRRMCMNMRSNFSSLAEALIQEGKLDSAENVLNKCLEVIPNEKLPYDYFSAQMARSFVQLGMEDKAKQIVTVMKDNSVAELNYYFSLDPNLVTSSDIKTELEREIKLNLMSCVYVVNEMENPGALGNEMENLFSYYNQMAGTLQKFMNKQIDKEVYKMEIENYDVDPFGKLDSEELETEVTSDSIED